MHPTTQRFVPAALAVLVFAVATAPAAELELKSLGNLQEASTARKYGPYVDVSAGATLGQTGQVSAGGRNFSLDDIDGSAIFSIEVGKSWKMKRLPLMTSVGFEGTFMSTSVSGKSADASTPTGGAFAANDLVAYSGDMNSLMFTLNASLSLDLYRYRARMGKILAGFRPYIGAGVGGGQTWFRNVKNQSRAQFQNTGTNAAAQTVFSVDEFINQWHWYAGLEWTWEDRHSAFIEYRDFSFGDLDNLTNFDTNGYVMGYRYRY